MRLKLTDNDTPPIYGVPPVAVCISSTQILVSNTLLQLKEPGLLGKLTDSRAEEGHMQDKPTASYTRKLQLTHLLATLPPELSFSGSGGLNQKPLAVATSLKTAFRASIMAQW